MVWGGRGAEGVSNGTSNTYCRNTSLWRTDFALSFRSERRIRTTRLRGLRILDAVTGPDVSQYSVSSSARLARDALYVIILTICGICNSKSQLEKSFSNKVSTIETQT